MEIVYKDTPRDTRSEDAVPNLNDQFADLIERLKSEGLKHVCKALPINGHTDLPAAANQTFLDAMSAARQDGVSAIFQEINDDSLRLHAFLAGRYHEWLMENSDADKIFLLHMVTFADSPATTIFTIKHVRRQYTDKTKYDLTTEVI